MWSNTSHEHVCEFNAKGNKLADDGSSQNFITSDGIARTIPIVDQMMWGDASLDVGWCLVHNIIHGLFGANVFHRDFQGWVLFYQRFHDFFDEDRFPVENISFCDLGMNAQHHPYLFHFFQDRVNVLDVGDTKCGIRRSASGVIFAGNDGWCPIGVLERTGLPDFFRLSIVGEIQCHQWLKVCRILPVLLHRSKDTVFIIQSQLRGGYRRFEIRHHKTATESGVCMFEYGGRGETISAVMVEVVWMSDSDRFVCHFKLFFLLLALFCLMLCSDTM